MCKTRKTIEEERKEKQRRRRCPHRVMSDAGETEKSGGSAWLGESTSETGENKEKEEHEQDDGEKKEETVMNGQQGEGGAGKWLAGEQEAKEENRKTVFASEKDLEAFLTRAPEEVERELTVGDDAAENTPPTAPISKEDDDFAKEQILAFRDGSPATRSRLLKTWEMDEEDVNKLLKDKGLLPEGVTSSAAAIYILCPAAKCSPRAVVEQGVKACPACQSVLERQSREDDEAITRAAIRGGSAEDWRQKGPNVGETGWYNASGSGSSTDRASRPGQGKPYWQNSQWHFSAMKGQGKATRNRMKGGGGYYADKGGYKGTNYHQGMAGPPVIGPRVITFCCFFSRFGHCRNEGPGRRCMNVHDLASLAQADMADLGDGRAVLMCEREAQWHYCRHNQAGRHQ